MDGITRKQLDRLIGLEVAKLSDHAAAEIVHWLTGRPIQFESSEECFVEVDEPATVPILARPPALKSVA